MDMVWIEIEMPLLLEDVTLSGELFDDVLRHGVHSLEVGGVGCDHAVHLADVSLTQLV